MMHREEVQVREKTPKIHLVPPSDKEPKEYLGLDETIYREICDRLNHGSHIGGYVSGVDGIDLLNGEILDYDERSLEGEVRNGKIYRGHVSQIAIVSDGIVSFGEYGYKHNKIPYIGGAGSETKKKTEITKEAEISEGNL